MVSTVIITLNEEKNIRECLESVKWSDEILIVDSGSSDNTISICKEYTDKIYFKEWSGYSLQKNFGIEKVKCDWVLSLDADERVTEELKNEINEVTARNEFDGYYIPRKAFFLGKWIKHSGWYPDYQLRLFRKGKGKFNGRDVHEAIILEHGDSLQSLKVGYLKNDLLHYPYGDLNHYFEKFNEYTTLSSVELSKKGKSFCFCSLIIKPALFFVKSYFLKLGFLDGWQGFAICVISSFNTLVKYAKLREIKRSKKLTSG